MQPPLPDENVQDYPRPPALEPVPQRIEVWFAGWQIVDTSRALRVLETHHAPTYYIPPDDISAELIPAAGRSFCEWKGAAQYFDVSVAASKVEQAAWTYPNPTAEFKIIAGYIAIYASQMELCRVGGIDVEPQPGDFYGGWVTPNLRGTVKGAPGTRHW